MPEQPDVPRRVEHLFRDHYGRMVAALVGVFGPERLDLVEDVVQEALLRAMRTWPFRGVPDRPRAWLTKVARNLALDAVRRSATLGRVERELVAWTPAAAEPEDVDPERIPDDRLRMMFLCCHPELPHEARVALTLKTLGGFGVAEIAHALRGKPATIAQRLTRAKARLQRSGIAFELPLREDLGPRLDSVLDVLYLMFNEGYHAHRGDALLRPELVEEAVRLAGLLLEMPETAQPRVHAVLALMLFAGARATARTDDDGGLLTLGLQDRSRWDRGWIRAGFHHLRASLAADQPSPYHVEAAIASCHAAAPTYAETDWTAILRRYDELVALRDTPIVRLNRAVARAKVDGAAAALADLDAIAGDAALAGYALLPAVRGHLLWQLDRRSEAEASLAEALRLAGTTPERRLLARRLAACRAGDSAPAL